MSNLALLDPLRVPNWDAMLKLTSGGTFFHSAMWARVLQATYGYRSVYIAKHEGTQFQSLLPLMVVDSWLTGRRGISLPFTDAVEPLGPDSAAIRELLLAAQAMATEHGWKYLELRGGHSALEDGPISTPFLSHTLKLSEDEKELFDHFDEPVRRAIRRGEQQGLVVEFSQEMRAVREFYSLLCLTRRRHGVPPQPFSFFVRIHEHALKHGHGWIVLARHGDIPVAGAVFFHFSRAATYKFGASNEAFQRMRGNNAVIWQAIRRYSLEGYTTLDFGRTSLSNEGLRRFKLGWGAREGQTGYLRFDPSNNSFITARDESRGWHNKVFRALPKPIFRLAGALLYRHIA